VHSSSVPRPSQLCVMCSVPPLLAVNAVLYCSSLPQLSFEEEDEAMLRTPSLAKATPMKNISARDALGSL